MSTSSAVVDDETSPRDQARGRRWRTLTLGLMIVGYAGYYLCRSNFSVVTPLLVDSLAATGMSPGVALRRLGFIASVGTLAYAVGKFLAGILGDFLGGRRNFLGGMLGALVCTFAFAAGGALPVFTAAWVGNRLSQSLGWAGMVKITGRWFDYRVSGTVMGVLSLSYLFGDAASRAFMGLLIDRGMGWRGVFVTCGVTLGALFLVCTRFLKESPADVGLPEGSAHPLNVFGASGERVEQDGLASLLGPLLARRAFWYVCLLSLTMTLLRETFNNWTPMYFKDVARLSPGRAAGLSALFPFLGGVSVLAAGFAGDSLGRAGRSLLLLGGLLSTGAALWQLARLAPGVDPAWPVGMVMLVGFLLIGPYSYLGGAVALDFGGKRGGGTASGIIDGVGYLAGILAGSGIARLAVVGGWGATFRALAVLAWVSSAVAALYVWDQLRSEVPQQS
ncbi:MAG: MFS transporter [Isosphaeraceae bacterium]|nr:MFS transporter [Isosphaeraceae bacterium]